MASKKKLIMDAAWFKLYLTLPEVKLTPKTFDGFIASEMAKEQEEEEEEFNRFTSQWSGPSKPKWHRSIKKKGNASYTAILWTDSRPFIWVVLGTKRRYVMVRAVGGGPYKAKSRVGDKRSYPGSPYVVTMLPGAGKGRASSARIHRIRARNTHQVIAKDRRTQFYTRMRGVMKLAADNFFVSSR